MRLLSFDLDGELRLTKYSPNEIPRYAILSHTWGDEDQEVTFEDVMKGVAEEKTGYRKIKFCRERAALDKLDYFWIDTCCIDKNSSVELNEAIVSMFKWYQQSARCYVYLSDVSEKRASADGGPLRADWKRALRDSRWFTRGWTVQELIAPKDVEFFSSEGQRLGTKASLEQSIYEITGIAVSALRGRDLSEFAVKERMSWSNERETKYEEDLAYSLLGIFRLSMLPMYGEGRDSAFRRLEEEITKRSHNAGAALAYRQSSDGNGPFNHQERLIPSSGNISSTMENISQKELLDLLYFDEIDVRLSTLKVAHKKTCEWFLNTEEYISWMRAQIPDTHKAFLWIKGKAGAGKSILMKFLHSEAKKAAKSDPQVLVLSFFFNARGGELEQSTLGVYRSLLWQLFEGAEDLREALELEASAKRVIQRSGWQLEILKQALIRAFVDLGSRTLCLFIDALDECQEKDVEDMIYFFEEVNEHVVEAEVDLRICLSSRHYPTIVVQSAIEITLEVQEEHGLDITRYIQSKLSRSITYKFGDLSSRVQAKSQGIFLWVALVIPMLNRAYAKGQISDLQNCLDDIPPELDDLFEKILFRDNESMHELRLCIQWTLFAKRPLTIQEYHFAIRGDNDPSIMKSWATGDIASEDMRRFVYSSSKGLIETTKITSRNKTVTVQFIHESIRTYFLAKKGFSKLWPDLCSPFVAYSHEILKTRCLSEIQLSVRSKTVSKMQSQQGMSRSASPADVDASIYAPPHRLLPDAAADAAILRRSTSEERPFLEYAVHHILYHADAAECDTIHQTQFLKYFPLSLWVFWSNLFQKYKIRRYTPQVSLLYILAEQNLPRLIKDELTRTLNMDIKGERHFFPMYAACFHKNKEAIRALLAIETGSQDFACQPLWLESWYNVRPQRQTPISYAVEHGYRDIFRLLLGTGKVDLYVGSSQSQDLLCTAVGKGYEDIVRMLLDTGKVNPDSKDIYDETALSKAARYGHKDILKIFLDISRLDPDARDSNNFTPLLYAANNGHIDSVKMLLDTGRVNPDPKDAFADTALSNSARNGHIHIVNMLLNTHRVDLNSENYSGDTPLSYAAENGHTDIVKMLLDTHRVNPDLKDVFNDTALSKAARSGHKDIVNMLLNTDRVDPDSKGHNGSTQLSYAAENGHTDIVKMLLDTHRVNPDPKDVFNDTALSKAARSGHKDIVNMLLNTDRVDPDSKGHNGSTPLSYAAENGHTDIVKMLLDTHRVNTDWKDSSSDTALSKAARSGHRDIIRMLLGTGSVDLDFENHNGTIILSVAAENGYTGIVKMLIDTGRVNPDLEDPNGDTALSKAARNGHRDIVKMLLDTGRVNPDSKDFNGDTALSKTAKGGHRDIFKMLLDTDRVDPNSKDFYGNTLLSKAARDGHRDIVKMLLDIDGVDPNSKDSSGETALSKAARAGYRNIVKMFLDIDKVDPDSKDFFGNTALSKAARGGHRDIVKMLLDTGRVDPGSKDADGDTALSKAARDGDVYIVKMLLDTDRVDVNSQDTLGWTPLAYAQKYGHDSVISILLEKASST